MPIDDQVESSAPAPDCTIAERDDVRHALEAMNSLPARQRQVLYLHACEDLALDEIADASRNTVIAHDTRDALVRLEALITTLAAQTIVSTEENHQFHVQCSPDLVNPCDLEIEGEANSGRGDSPSLQIRLVATERMPPGGLGGAELRRLCNLNTMVKAPLGHTVVLGVTPVGKMTSVFVIQLTAAE
jgi:hypothetical protein